MEERRVLMSEGTARTKVRRHDRAWRAQEAADKLS